MPALYVSQQGCWVSLSQESLLVKQRDTVLATVQLPLLEQVLIFGQSQLTTPAVRACLQRDIPIAYLSRLGWCYGRALSLTRGYRHLARYQQELSFGDRFAVAQALVRGKLHNSRVLLQRQQRRLGGEQLTTALDRLAALSQQVRSAASLEQLLGLEGAGAASYFAALGICLADSPFTFRLRRRRPPGDEVNALLSFGYQVLWNHLLALLELQGLDPYQACLHQGSERHAALASDLIEEFRAPLVDALVLYLINTRQIQPGADFEWRDGGCFLNDRGRRTFLQTWLRRMEEPLADRQPHWDLLGRQVRRYQQFVYQPATGYDPYPMP
ncbi:MAG: CRISPR-associated endonuclease Cas1 [Spirulinaceae cyanobacterium SM2_1_0]|nr:CRISPR-associated endonuclease Cas1 [Spirulinaceae cyanobacterium SM2_1_0]